MSAYTPLLRSIKSCAHTCLKQFICSPEHIVRRIDQAQSKEPCMYCHVREGYDYRIIHKKKRLGDDRY